MALALALVSMAARASQGWAFHRACPDRSFKCGDGVELELMLVHELIRQQGIMPSLYTHPYGNGHRVNLWNERRPR